MVNAETLLDEPLLDGGRYLDAEQAGRVARWIDAAFAGDDLDEIPPFAVAMSLASESCLLGDRVLTEAETWRITGYVRPGEYVEDAAS
jgi:hypothetical protein